MSELKNVIAEVQLRDFDVPDAVGIYPRSGHGHRIRLRELTGSQLSDLCDNFRAQVFRVAGKIDSRRDNLGLTSEDFAKLIED